MSEHQSPGDNQPKSLYIHVPFCRHHCGYCNFTVVANRDYLVADYLRAIELEMSRLESRYSLETVYLGGGTPSRLPATALRQLLNLIERHFQLKSGCEFTLEANPEDLPGEIGPVIRESPVNRLSLGVQSFDPIRLQLLDRNHSPTQIHDSVEFARQAVPQFSIDLIFGVCGDTSGTWQRDLETAIASGAGHLSTYELTIEKGTRFWNLQLHNNAMRTNDDTSADLFEQTIATLTDAGFRHYEVSSFALPGQLSRHNQVYWSGRPWIGLGPGASGFANAQRYTNFRSVHRYLREILAGNPCIEETQRLSPGELALERIVFGLRQLAGIDLVEWTCQTGFQLVEIVPADVLEDLDRLGLIEIESDYLRLTRSGLLLGDHVCQQILQRGTARES